jgi:acyl carrier protein
VLGGVWSGYALVMFGNKAKFSQDCILPFWSMFFVNKSVRESASFQELGLDSLDTVEVVMAVEEEFAVVIPDAEADKINSCAQAIEYIAAHPSAK